MRKPMTFFELQSVQRDHDLRNHPDIYTLPLFDKINHYVLHYAKYTSRLVSKKSHDDIIKELKRTYVDAFLISLAASNALNIDLDIEMRKIFGIIPQDIASFVQNPKKLALSELKEYSRDILALAAGSMADTMEKRDHFDDKDARPILIQNIIKIIGMILFGSHHLNFDIVEASLSRRSQIAALKIT